MVALPAVMWALHMSHSPRKCVVDLPLGSSSGVFFSIKSPSTQMTLSSLCQVDIRTTQDTQCLDLSCYRILQTRAEILSELGFI